MGCAPEGYSMEAAHRFVQILQEKLELLWHQSQEEARFLMLTR